MRSISLVNKLEVDYKGSLFKSAICLVDIDEDGLNELCVGFTNGELHAYKGLDTTKPWKLSKGLGSLVVLCGGHVRSKDETLLCALDSEGRCNLFDVKEEHVTSDHDGSYVGSPPSGAPTCSPTEEMRLVHKEHLPPNAKVAILEDVDNDGVAELIIGYTDRYVRIYKWTVQGDPLDDVEKKLSKQNTEETDKKSTLSFSLSLSKEPKHLSPAPRQKSADTAEEGTINNNNSTPYHPVGSFVLLKQFSLIGQIGSLAVCTTVEGLNQLIVSQPNGGYCILGQYDEDGFTENISTPTSVEAPSPSNQDSYPIFYPITAYGNRSFQQQHINTEIIGGIRRQKGATGVIGLATHDGYFIILDNTYFSGQNPVKNSSKNNWFAMSKVDVTNDGDDEIVLCDLNGMTYIIDKERNIVSYNFNENVAAFCAGYYGNKGRSTPCLCYVTLSGKIHLYYDVWIDAIKVRCVHAALIEKIKRKPELHYLLELLRGESGEVDHEKLQSLVKQSASLNRFSSSLFTKNR
eukprot:TCONS_00019798-protein